MNINNSKLKIFTGNANPQLAQEISDYLGVPLGLAKVGRFSDGEISLTIGESVRGCDAFVIQPTCPPVNENLMELLIMIDALRRASARRITAVIPYYGYARQERKTRARDPISAKLVANLIMAAGARRVIAMDLHAGAIQGFFDIPVDHLLGSKILADYYRKKNLTDVVVVSPDLGGVTRARELAERVGSEIDIAILEKRRPSPNEAKIMHLIGDVKGKTVIITDDMIDTAGTITLGAQAVMEHGAKEVYACCTHPVLSGPAVERIKNSCIKEVLVTNTIPLSEEKKIDKIKVLSVAPLLGEAIMRVHKDLSVSELFD
ncbi:MAG TPA: ribose-phosphate pyrophosphokinase [Peptococcaceae bacterium]|nr:MAG: Ribose-phosphate pyrophosphokinase [Clostridia bacterium 41_269]HBT20690.1 ribose-phosphate pyrophosphokinase [Peptococcaceae bacterium]